MFDTIYSDAVRCPLCGRSLEWQSKDGPCLFERLTIHELMETTNAPVFYSSCDECGIWVEVSVRRQVKLTPAQQAQFREEQELMPGSSSPRCASFAGLASWYVPDA